MKIVVVGSRGSLGAALVKHWNDPFVEERIAANVGRPIAASNDEIAPLNLPDFDMCSRLATLDMIGDLKPDVVINVAGVNHIDWLESHANTARNLHATGPAHLRDASKRVGAKFVQFSCAEVFYRSKLEPGAADVRERAESPEAARKRVKPFADDGDSPLPIDPSAPGFDELTVPNPANVYAKTKLESERVASEAENSLILRLSALFGEPSDYSSGNLVSSLLNAFCRANRISVINDRLVEPLWAIDVLCALKTLLRADATGLYHLTGGSRGTPKEIAEFLLKQTGLRDREIVGITTEEYGAKVPQSAFPILASTKYDQVDGAYKLPDWKKSIDDYFERRANMFM